MKKNVCFYCNGPDPSSEKLPWQRFPVVWVCLAAVIRALPVSVEVFDLSLIVTSNICPISNTSRNLAAASIR